VLAGILVWMLVTARLWRRGGGDAVGAMWLCVMAAPAALLGARLYSWFTDNAHGLSSAPFDFAGGGLGIYGAVAGGAAALFIGLRSRGWPVGTFFDCAVPGLALGQAVGRLGNYFNQELYGHPSTLPWALHVDEAYRPPGDLDIATYHPLFFYEALWDVLCAAILLGLLRVLPQRFGGGAVAACYLALYGFGRLLLEGLREDSSYEIAGLRFNQIVSLAAMATTPLVLSMLARRRDRRR
jgi:prolipoprotein diacylglyceryl transferase